LSDDISEIRRGVSELHTALALHDQKVESNLAQVVSAQERMATAVERIGEATIAIKAVAERLGNGRTSSGIVLDRKTLAWLIALAIGGMTAAGGGSEVVRRMLDAALGGH